MSEFVKNGEFDIMQKGIDMQKGVINLEGTQK